MQDRQSKDHRHATRPRRTLPLLAMLLGACAAPVDESQANPLVEEGWAFVYPGRAESAKSPIDLRSLNEPVAGQSGFIRLSDDGNSFVLGDGTPARFWAIGSGMFQGSPDEMKKHVRFLAGIGVNMVRLHAQICSPGPNSKLTDVNEKEIDGIWRFVAEAKTQGHLCHHLPLLGAPRRRDPLGDRRRQRPRRPLGPALLRRDPAERLQSVGRGPLHPAEPLYRHPPGEGPGRRHHPGPERGQPPLLHDDPACPRPRKPNSVGSSPTGWPRSTASRDRCPKPGRRQARRRRFRPRPGRAPPALGVPQARSPAAWASARPTSSSSSSRRRGIFMPDMKTFYREELGCGQLINASNWRSANQALQDDSERWSYAADRRDRGQPLLQRRRPRRPEQRLEDRPGRPLLAAFRADQPSRAAGQPQAGRRPSDDRHREHLGRPARLSVRGAVPGLGLSVA